jgi:hypothetical protein
MSDQPARPSSLAEALTTLQTRLPRITKDATADTGKYTYAYANLSSITATVTPILEALALYWACLPTMRDDGQFVLRYRLEHAPTGEHIEGDYPLSSGTPQTMGGQITYARRYALCAVLGIAPAEDDDDAQAAEADASRGSSWQAPANPRERKATRSRNTAAEDTAWNTPEAEKLPGSILPRDVTKLNILLSNLGARTHSDRMAVITARLDLAATLDSSKDLSMAQGTELIKLLQAEADKT